MWHLVKDWWSIWDRYQYPTYSASSISEIWDKMYDHWYPFVFYLVSSLARTTSIWDQVTLRLLASPGWMVGQFPLPRKCWNIDWEGIPMRIKECLREFPNPTSNLDILARLKKLVPNNSLSQLIIFLHLKK